MFSFPRFYSWHWWDVPRGVPCFTLRRRPQWRHSLRAPLNPTCVSFFPLIHPPYSSLSFIHLILPSHASTLFFPLMHPPYSSLSFIHLQVRMRPVSLTLVPAVPPVPSKPSKPSSGSNRSPPPPPPPPPPPLTSATVTITQIKSAFAFGSAVNAAILYNKKFQQVGDTTDRQARRKPGG